jgi:hypothetical protein
MQNHSECQDVCSPTPQRTSIISISYQTSKQSSTHLPAFSAQLSAFAQSLFSLSLSLSLTPHNFTHQNPKQSLIISHSSTSSACNPRTLTLFDLYMPSPSPIIPIPIPSQHHHKNEPAHDNFSQTHQTQKERRLYTEISVVPNETNESKTPMMQVNMHAFCV